VDKPEIAEKHPICPPGRPSPTVVTSVKRRFSDECAIALYCGSVSGTGGWTDEGQEAGSGYGSKRAMGLKNLSEFLGIDCLATFLEWPNFKYYIYYMNK
jgi:hypothetical protein